MSDDKLVSFVILGVLFLVIILVLSLSYTRYLEHSCVLSAMLHSYQATDIQAICVHR